LIDVVERRTDEATLCVALALCEPLVALGLSSACADAGIGIVAQAPALADPPGPRGARVVVVGDPASLPSDVIGGLVAQQAGVLVLAHGLNADVVRSSIRAGARGYLDLSSALDVIVDGIRAVSEGHLALALSCQTALFAAPHEEKRPPLSEGDRDPRPHEPGVDQPRDRG
jgi:DNA-binding NarL/FixJ family response regulator